MITLHFKNEVKKSGLIRLSFKMDSVYKDPHDCNFPLAIKPQLAKHKSREDQRDAGMGKVLVTPGRFPGNLQAFEYCLE